MSTVATNFGAGIPDLTLFSQFKEENKNTSLSDFYDKYASEKQKNRFVDKLSFDPLSSKYFDMFMDPSLRPPSDHYVHDKLSLSPSQQEAFKRNGFVVTEEEHSFGRGYYKIFNNDLPVLVTTDSILHAFHKSYDTILEELETTYCSVALMTIFKGMLNSLKELDSKFPDGPFRQCFRDADLFLTVAVNLLNSEEYHRTAGDKQEEVVNTPNKRGEPKSKAFILPVFGDIAAVEQALSACKTNSSLRISLFGKDREVDFTLFKPRGHYAKSAELRQYFRAVSWVGEIDMALSGFDSNLRQLGSAVVLHMLLSHDVKSQSTFFTYNKIIEALVGPSTAMDMKQLDLLMNEIFPMKSHAKVNSEEALVTLQAKLKETKLGMKSFNDKDSRSFTFIGKKFTLDGWAQAKMVNSETDPIMVDDKMVDRHITSCVEVAFSVFQNDDATSLIHERITHPKNHVQFRDNLPFHSHLIAARKTIDSLPEESWSTSLYTYWLSALRKLSVPLDERYPEAMRTKAYGMKKMNAQLASWAQLRHDNILYVEQPRFSWTCCDYPDGYVEPMVEFWEAMEKTCLAAAEVMKLTEHKKNNRRINTSLFFSNFAEQVRILRDISVLELAQQPLKPEHKTFLKNVVEIHETFGSGASTTWGGWYPSLFYGGPQDAGNKDLICCDTFTNSPSKYDPGCVVHQSLSHPRRMLMAIHNGKEAVVYAGPVFNLYEFELPGLQRMSDDEWKEKVKNKQIPPLPEWTQSYLVPN